MHAPLRHTNPGRDGNGGKQSRHAMSMDCHGLRRDVLGSRVLSVLTTPSRLHSASASRAVQPGSARAEGAGCGPATCGNPLCVSGERSASAFPSPQLLQPLPTLPTCWGAPPKPFQQNMGEGTSRQWLAVGVSSGALAGGKMALAGGKMAWAGGKMGLQTIAKHRSAPTRPLATSVSIRSTTCRPDQRVAC